MVEIPKVEYRYELYGKFSPLLSRLASTFLPINSEPMIGVDISDRIELGPIYVDFLMYLDKELPKKQELSLNKRTTEVGIVSTMPTDSGTELELEIFTFYHGGLKSTNTFNLEAHLGALQSTHIGFRKTKVVNLLRDYGERLVQVSGK